MLDTFVLRFTYLTLRYLLVFNLGFSTSRRLKLDLWALDSCLGEFLIDVFSDREPGLTLNFGSFDNYDSIPALPSFFSLVFL